MKAKGTGNAGFETLPTVWHFIGSLEIGGAERFLENLTEALDRKGLTQKVISLKKGGVLASRIRKNQIEVIELGFRPHAIVRLIRELRKNPGIIVQTWLYHSDLLVSLIVRCFTRNPIIWAIHNGNIERRVLGWKTRVLVRLCASLSHWLPLRVICCSDSAAELHFDIGYSRSNLVVINNGVDTKKFKPKNTISSSDAKVDMPLIGMGARFHPVKRYDIFFSVASKVLSLYPHAKFVAFGSGVDSKNCEIVKLYRSCRMENKITCLGEVDEVASILETLDIYISTSEVEAFPVSIAEAMAMGLPCVVTDVGDTACLLGDTGTLVVRNDVDQFVAALVAMIELGRLQRDELGRKARNRIDSYFTIEKSSEKYADLYSTVLGEIAN